MSAAFGRAGHGENRDDGKVTMEISREMVALMKDYLGRGPTRARTYIRDDLVVCVMQDTITKAERMLSQDGNERAVREIRRVFQDSFRDDAEAIVQKATGRTVVSFMSDHDIATDVAAEIFVLDPGLTSRDAAGDGHARAAVPDVTQTD